MFLDPQTGSVPVRIPMSLSVLGHTECGGWLVLSWVSSLAFYKRTDGAAPFWANSLNRSTLFSHLAITGRSTFKPRELEDKIDQTLELDSPPYWFS